MINRFSHDQDESVDTILLKIRQDIKALERAQKFTYICIKIKGSIQTETLTF